MANTALRLYSFAAQPAGTCSSSPRLHYWGSRTLGCHTSGTGVPAPGARPLLFPPHPSIHYHPAHLVPGPAAASFPKLV